MSEQSDKQTPDFMQLWREWLTQSERQLNALSNEALNNEAVARSMGGYLEVYTAFQRLLADGMQRYLSFMNMPSRADVVTLGETLRIIDERLAKIEETLQIAAETMGERERRPAREPTRTRVPPGFPTLGEDGATIPEGLRR